MDIKFDRMAMVQAVIMFVDYMTSKGWEECSFRRELIDRFGL